MRAPLVLVLGLATFATSPAAHAQDDDWGFDDEETYVSESAGSEDASEPEEADEPFWELTGDVSLGTSYNYLEHDSATGTPYRDVSRLRTQLDLQLDLDLPWDWKARVEGYAFYDFAYLIRGRSEYTRDVRDDYIWEVDTREVWLLGTLASSLDLKLGRQILNWGRSDTVRVLDVLNPLDNREPGLVDIEDLRLPLTMARVDYYPDWIPDDWGDWSLQLVVLPEFRQDRSPSIGNDFNPSPFLFDFPSNKPDRFFDEPEFGGSVTGTFSGWDVSIYAARIYANTPLIVFVPTPTGVSGFQRHAHMTMVGGGGNFTIESWLLKAEIAWFDEVEYAKATPGPLLPTLRVVEKSRIDTMAGIEYYGVNDLQIALEAVHRHIFGFDESSMQFDFAGLPLTFAEEDTYDLALRVTADFMNSRLRVTAVGLVFLGGSSHAGSVVRAEATYELMDALNLGGGIVLYQSGDSPATENIGRNDRLFLRLEYSF